jgi:cobalt/nickel transport system ATP-binding protein
MSEAIVQVRGLSHVYPDRTEVSLRGVELEVRPGEITALLAANGAGKTTLLQHIAGLLQPTQGSIRVFGRDPFRDFEEVRTRLGVVFQNPAEQIIGPTVREDVALGLGHLKLSRRELEAKVMAVLESLEIAHLAQRIPHYLSGGEIRNVALAGALAAEPELLILDEPFAELDARAVRELTALLKRINGERGMAIIFTSHHLEPVAMLAGSVYVLDGGGVVAQGPPLEVFRQTELLARSNLRPPDLFVLADLLRRGGLNVEPDWDAAQMAAEILAAFGIEQADPGVQ